MALPKSFSEIQLDARGAEFVIHKPSGVRYYINRKLDPKLRGTSAMRTTPWTDAERAGEPSRAPADPVVSAGADIVDRKLAEARNSPTAKYDNFDRKPPVESGSAMMAAKRRPITARFIKGTAPKDDEHEYC